MEDIESFVNLARRFAAEAAPPTGGGREWTTHVLSPQRSQRFELLLHLIANLERPLVVSGPQGIGKSTLLGMLREQAFENWLVVALTASASLDYSRVIDQIAVQALRSSFSEAAVLSYLAQLGRGKTTLILTVDDAGQLAPGLLETLWRFSKTYPSVRLVLALSPDEAHIKVTTDSSAMADCHFVDVPPLLESQLDGYLRRLVSQIPGLLSPDDITPARCRSLYQTSHGVPGRVIDALKAERHAEHRAGLGQQRLALSMVGGAALLTVAWGLWQWWPDLTHRTHANVTTTSVPLALPGVESNAALHHPDSPPAAPLAEPSKKIDEAPLNLPNMVDKPLALGGKPATPAVDESPKPAPSLLPLPITLPKSAPHDKQAAPPESTPGSVLSVLSKQMQAMPAPESKSAAAEAPSKASAALPKDKDIAVADKPVPAANTAPAPSAPAKPTAPLIPSAPVATPLPVPPQELPIKPLAAPALALPSKPTVATPTVTPPPNVEAAKPLPPVAPVKPTLPAATPLTPPLAKVDKEKEKDKADSKPKNTPVHVPGIAGVSGADWLMTQPAGHYTLRVMTAQTPASVKTLLERYPALKSRLGTYRAKGHNGIYWYPVYYGVFASLKEAQKAAADLPEALGKASPRALHAVQDEIRAESQ